ncbi:MAG: cyclic nucleotide-binding domain-containing protein [Desulfobacteraceae bacterium]|nr:cyclic nucleotide-binding domain-containing protein [Desulfobacteraceae bacterium]
MGLQFGTIQSFYENQMIFKEGQLGNIGYLIKTGVVTIYKIIDGEKKVLSELKPGEIFGEMCIINESPRTAYAEAKEFCDLVVIDKETLFKMLKQSPKIIQTITVLLMKRLANTLTMLEHEDDESPNSKRMLNICSLLFIMTSYEGGINYNFFCEKVNDIGLPVSKTELDNIIKRLTELKIVELSDDGKKEKTLKVIESEKLLL